MKTLLVMICASTMLAASCGSTTNELEVQYAEIGGGSASIGEMHSACDLAMSADVAGRYRVASLTGVYEEVGAGVWEPHTYINLEALESWAGDAQDVTVRISGGPLPDGSTVQQFVELEQGETIGALLGPVPAWNAGFHFLEVEHVFKEAGDSMSNGYVRAQRLELSGIFAQAIEQGECPIDVEPISETSDSESQRAPREDSPEDGTEVPINQG